MKTVSVDFATPSWLGRQHSRVMLEAELTFYKDQCRAMASEVETMVDALKRGEGVIVGGMTIIRSAETS